MYPSIRGNSGAKCVLVLEERLVQNVKVYFTKRKVFYDLSVHQEYSQGRHTFKEAPTVVGVMASLTLFSGFDS